MSKVSDYHNTYIMLEGDDTKYYLVSFDLEKQLVDKNTNLHNALTKIVSIIDAWMNEGDYDDVAIYEIAKQALEENE